MRKPSREVLPWRNGKAGENSAMSFSWSATRSPEKRFFLKASLTSHRCHPGKIVISSSLGVGFSSMRNIFSRVLVSFGTIKIPAFNCLISGEKKILHNLYLVSLIFTLRDVWRLERVVLFVIWSLFSIFTGISHAQRIHRKNHPTIHVRYTQYFIWVDSFCGDIWVRWYFI